MENFNNLVTGILEPEDLVDDGWTDIIGKLLLRMREADARPTRRPGGVAEAVELADFEKMESIRARVDTIVNDPNTAEALKPYYRQFCKRPCFHDEYLDTFNRPNVTLVDTDGKGVDRITEHGVVVGETEYELDCLIYATGFEVGTDYTRRAGCEIIGRDGLTLTEKWHDGASTLHGMHTRGFPNLLIFSLQQSGFTANFPHALDEQSRHAAYILRHALRPRRRHGRGVAGGRGRLGADDPRAGPVQPRLPRVVHAGLLQQRGQAERARRPQRLLRRRLGGVLQGPRRLARRRHAARPRADDAEAVAAPSVSCGTPRTRHSGPRRSESSSLNRARALPPMNAARWSSGNAATSSLRSWMYSGVWSACGKSDAHRKRSTP